MEKKRIAVGMSGGVDSAVAAYLLKEQGHSVTGIFMKNWDEQAEGEEECTAAEDFDDVRRVCDQIGIPYYTVNFTQEYWQRVFSLFLKEYQAGRTPNPDVLCNKEIKFASFLDFCMQTGAQYMATGHYCRLDREGGGVRLLKGVDPSKDQSYFLCMLKKEQLAPALFPVGGMTKEQVREIAKKAGLAVAQKKDSTGICFIGERKFRAFLKKYLPAQPGEMRTLDGRAVGRHEGLMYYTLGQRRGLGIGGAGNGQRWFVVQKDLKNNILYVQQGPDSPALYSRLCRTEPFSFINSPPAREFSCCCRYRYRQPDQRVRVRILESGEALIEAEQPQRAVTPGQYAVLYQGEECLGGGVVQEVFAMQEAGKKKEEKEGCL